MELVLSLFPGLGLLDMAFEGEGFCVVRGPDQLWGGDVKQFHPPAGRFDGVIGGPPCQAFSRLRHIVKLNHERHPDKYHLAENLIPEFERVVEEARPAWYLMENVPDAPWPSINPYIQRSFVLNNRWCVDATPQNRERRFWFGHRDRDINPLAHIEVALFEPLEWEYAVTAAGSGGGAPIPVRMNTGKKLKSALRQPKSRPNTRTVEDYLRLQGLPEDFFDRKSPFTVAGKRMMVGNGVPLPVGKAVARAVRLALEALQ